MRRGLDDIIESLILRAEADPVFGQGDDRVLAHAACTLRRRSATSHGVLLTSSSFCWRQATRPPPPNWLGVSSGCGGVLNFWSGSADEVDAGELTLLKATVQQRCFRTRAVINGSARIVAAPSISLGPGVIPRGHTVGFNISMTNHNEAL